MKNGLILACALAVVLSCATLKLTSSSYDNVYSHVNDADNLYFWEQFHAGNINNLDSILFKLERQYKNDTTNLLAASHLGFAHTWALSEWRRAPKIGAKLPLHVVASYQYFSKAYQLNPNDKRILGFLADMQVAYGRLKKSDQLLKEAYAMGLQSIEDWPEFNKFTIAVTYADLDPKSKEFQQALDWQWSTLDDCYISPIDKANPAIAAYLKKDMSSHNLGKKRACYNNWIAPHNIEGYFLLMGDMIVKTGDYKTASKIYELSKASPNYSTWVFKELLEKRIHNAERNTVTFLDKKQTGIDNVIINNSGSLCMSCHKTSDKDNEFYKNYDVAKFFKLQNIYALKKQ